MHPTFDLPNPQVVDKELKEFIVVNKGCCYRKYQTRKQQIYVLVIIISFITVKL